MRISNQNSSIYIPSLQMLFEPGRISILNPSIISIRLRDALWTRTRPHINSETLHLYLKLADALWTRTRPHINSETLHLYLKLADALWTRTRPHINSEPLHLYSKLSDALVLLISNARRCSQNSKSGHAAYLWTFYQQFKIY